MTVNETLISGAEHPAVLALSAAMMGMPAFLGKSNASPYVQRQAMTEAYKREQDRIQGDIERAFGMTTPIGAPSFAPQRLKPDKLTRAQKKAQREEREKARRRALVNTDLRVIDRQEYRKHEHSVDKEIREGMEYLGLNR
jgi:hypothetical protein